MYYSINHPVVGGGGRPVLEGINVKEKPEALPRLHKSNWPSTRDI